MGLVSLASRVLIMNTYLVFVIQAFDEFDKTRDVLTELVTLELIAKTEEEAMKKAQELVKKKGYRLSRVIEKENGT